MQVVLFDIESSNLEADFGHEISFAWKLLGEKTVHHFDITETSAFWRDRTNDGTLVRRSAKVLSQADIWVSWYGRYFDIPFLDSRLVFHKSTPLPPVPHVDCWRISRFKMHIHSNRLKSVSEFLGIKEKTPLLPHVWHRAACGHRADIKYVLEHNIQDVLVLEEAYLRLRPLAHDHPNLALLMEPPKKGEPFKTYCPICGAENSMTERRSRIAKVSSTQIFQCRKCGGYGRGSSERHEGIVIR